VKCRQRLENEGGYSSPPHSSNQNLEISVDNAVGVKEFEGRKEGGHQVPSDLFVVMLQFHHTIEQLATHHLIQQQKQKQSAAAAVSSQKGVK
jgi:hypothetical protein